MNDQQLLRYARHLMLDDFGVEGQRRLLHSHALLIGAGGLGSPAALYLAAAGVGRLTVVDDDCVDLTNLQRQIAHATSRIGQPKVDSLRASIASINADVQVTGHAGRADPDLLDRRVPECDVVLDCSDNFATRQAVNAACVRHRKPLVAGAAIAWDAQVSVYDTRHVDAPCYACVFSQDARHDEVACATLGVFSPLVGIVGCVQAAEALKLLLGIGGSLAGRLQMLDGRSMTWTELRLPRHPDCAVCSAR